MVPKAQRQHWSWWDLYVGVGTGASTLFSQSLSAKQQSPAVTQESFKATQEASLQKYGEE